MIVDQSQETAYPSYLALDEILTPPPRTRPGGSGGTLLAVALRAQGLWFEQLLRELGALQRGLDHGDGPGALRAVDRSLRILRALVAQLEVVEPLAAWELADGETAGPGAFEPAGFRETEAVLGWRDRRPPSADRRPPSADRRPPSAEPYPAGGSPDGGGVTEAEAARHRPSVFDSLLGYLAARGYPVPCDLLYRDVSSPAAPSPGLQDVLVRVHRDDGAAAQICERLVDLDEGFQEWRYRHARIVERATGDDADPRGDVFAPVFPDLWAVRSLL
ncbi:tryptophan 2,3-dioxygenase [Streptosporangium sp. NPDC004379]|uniref:tryptophan 2,3-dioxygenase n=1 Tax=Streptosporangium sp. NPDC004379 TaxID=3366189 RepID=UPI003699B21B